MFCSRLARRNVLFFCRPSPNSQDPRPRPATHHGVSGLFLFCDVDHTSIGVDVVVVESYSRGAWSKGSHPTPATLPPWYQCLGPAAAHTLTPLSPHPTPSPTQDDFEAEFEDDADERLLRKMPSPLPTPSPSPITGPQLLRPMVGECYQFTGKDGNGDENRYEVCGYKSVRQTIVKNGHSYSTGYWARWQTVQEDGKTKYTAHLYNDGESCGPVRRQTAVVFECDPKLKGPKLLSATEPAMCAYELRMALPEWCEIEKMVRAHAVRGEEGVGCRLLGTLPLFFLLWQYIA